MRTKTPLGLDVFYDGDWHPVASEVWSRDPVEVSRGRSSETKRVRPTVVTALFGNNDRKWSPRRPESELYGLIGPATPMRVYTTLFADGYDRTVGSGWGTTPDSQAKSTGRVDRLWDNTLSVGSGSTSVGSGVGVHTQTTTAGLRLSVLDDVAANAWRDCEVRIRFTPQLSNVTGASIQPGNLVLRFVDSNNYYLARVAITTAEAVTVSIIKLEAAAETVLSGPVTVSGLTFSGQTLAAAFLAEGPVLGAKVWDPATGEPYDFQTTAVDDTFAAAGQIGVRTGVPTGNTNVPVTVHYDQLEVRSPEAMAEIDSWPQRQSLDGRDRSVPIRANGIMQRLGVSGVGTNARSPLRRWYDQQTTRPVVYWPIEEEDSATTQAESGLSGGTPLTLNGPARAGSRLAPRGALAAVSAVGGFVSATNGAGRGGYTTAPVTSMASPTAMVIDFNMAVNVIAPTSEDAEDIEIRPFSLSQFFTPVGQVLFIIYTGTGDFTVSIFGPGGTDNAVFNNPTAVLAAVDGRVNNYRIILQNDGADIDVTLLINGSTIGATTATANQIPEFTNATLVLPEMARRSALGTAVEDIEVTICHFAIWLTAAAPSPYVASTGWAGEEATDRMVRLADEEGFPIVVTAEASTLLGPQRTIPPLESINEAADADGGILLEPRGRPGLMYKTQASLYNPPATVALGFTVGDEVREPSEPSEDLDFVVNDVTVRRRGGGESTVVKTSGSRNVNDPATDAQGVGRRQPPPAELNLAGPAQTLQQAAWRVTVGTVDEPRYPALAMSPSMLHEAGKTSKLQDVASVDIGDRVSLANPPSGGRLEEQQVQGTYSIFESHRWIKEAVTTPATPWLVGTIGASRVDTAGSETFEAVDNTETGIDVGNNVDGGWSQNTPYDIVIGGERMTLTSATTPGSTQTLTVTRSVNSVVKSHSPGAQIRVYQPIRVAREP